MAPKKELKRIEIEVVNTVDQILSDSEIISEKLNELGSSEGGDFLKDLDQECKSVMVSEIEPLMIAKKKFKPEEELKSSKKTVKKIKKQAQDLLKHLDEFEEKILMYDVPYLDECESFGSYLECLQEFMKIWKQEAEKGRVKGDKCLIEWLQQLDQSDYKQRKTTFEAMKTVLIDLGTPISHHLTEFLSLVAVSAEWKGILDDVAAILGFLSVEENSIVIKGFLFVVKFLEKTLTESKKCSTYSGDSVYSLDSSEQEVFRLILREVLRLEVALCCPALPMMLIDDLNLYMGSHLREAFGNKLKNVISEINELKMEMFSVPVRDEDPEPLYRLKALKGTLDVGIKEIWNKLDLQSC